MQQGASEVSPTACKYEVSNLYLLHFTVDSGFVLDNVLLMVVAV